MTGRPELISGKRQIIFGELTRVPSLAMVNMANKSHTITAEIEVPESGAEGVIAAVGGSTGGWSLYTKDGKPKYCYNFFGLERTYVEGESTLAPGNHQVRMEFAYDGGGIAKGGTIRLFVDGKQTGEGHVAQTEPFAFGEESCDVGHEAGSPVTPDYGRMAAVNSPARCAGSSSTRTLRRMTTPISSRRSNACSSRWRNSRRQGLRFANGREGFTRAG